MKKSFSVGKDIWVKSAALLLIIAVGAGTAAVLPTWVSGSVPRVNTVFPDIKSYTPSVSCSGVIEYADTHSVVCDIPVVISEYKVSTGKHADAGQTAAVVDKSATVQQLKALYGTAAPSDMTIDDIPEQITSDISGTVCALGAKGTLIPAGEPIVSIGEQSELQMTAAVSQRDISKVDIGQSVVITAADKSYIGTVSEISGFARKEYDTADSVVDVGIKVDDADSDLRSGYSAEGKIQTGYEQKILTLPYDAICQDDKGEYVYVFSSGSAKRRDITTGVELSGCAEVSGVGISDEVIMHSEQLSADCLVIRDGIVSREDE